MNLWNLLMLKLRAAFTVHEADASVHHAKYTDADVAAMLATYGNIGIGTVTVPQKLSIQGNIELENTSDNNTGIIYKNGVRFLNNFRHPTGNLNRPTGNNIFIGRESGNFNVGSGADHVYHGSNNVGVGFQTFKNLTIGYNNMAMGAATLRNVTTGANNMGVGDGSLQYVTTSTDNSGIGYYSLKYVTGSGNVAIGSNSGKGVYGSSNIARNTLIGKSTGQNLITGGNYNVLIGFATGNNVTTGDHNVIIGYDIDALTATIDNYMSIGNLIFGTGIDGTGTAVSSGNIGIGVQTPTAKLDVNSDIFRLRTAKTPSSAGDTGNAGDICWDASYIYVCVATNTWKRTAIATW